MTEKHTSTSWKMGRRSVLKKGAVATGVLTMGTTAVSGTAAAGIGDGRVLDYHLNNINYDREKGEIKGDGYIHDSSPEDNSGTWSVEEKEPVIKDGAVGNAFEFDGAEDYISIDKDMSLQVEEVTISAWANPNQNDYSYIFDGPGHNYSLKEDDNTEKPMLQFFTSGNTVNQLTADKALPTGTWSHVAATYNKDNGEMRMYIDGELAGSGTASGPIQRYEDGYCWDDTAEARVGRYLKTSSVGGAYFYDGKLDEVRVYNRPLPEGEIQELADMGG